jgi:hypothetical protein
VLHGVQFAPLVSQPGIVRAPVPGGFSGGGQIAVSEQVGGALERRPRRRESSTSGSSASMAAIRSVGNTVRPWSPGGETRPGASESNRIAGSGSGGRRSIPVREV